MPKIMKLVMDIHLETAFTEEDIKDLEAFKEEQANGFPTVQREMIEQIESAGFFNVSMTNFKYVEVTDND